MRIAISELSSEPRAIDVRRKPILVEREREREGSSERVVRQKGRERRRVTDIKMNESGNERVPRSD